MNFEFCTCQDDMNYQEYIKFLLLHNQDLNLPYSFGLTFSFICSPLLYGKTILLRSEETDEVIGATGFVYGTGSNDYQDQDVCQVEVAFILDEYRNTSLFLNGLNVLLQEIKLGNPEVSKIQFWTTTEDKVLNKLFSKFHKLPNSTKMIVNNRAQYVISFHELEVYCQRFLKYINKNATHISWTRIIE